MAAAWLFFRDETGQALTEYAFILLFVALCLVLAVGAFGEKLYGLVQKAIEAFNV